MTVPRGYCLGRLPTPLQGTSHNSPEMTPRKEFTQLAGLLAAKLIEWRVRLSLDAIVEIPGCLSMPDKIESLHVVTGTPCSD